MAHPLRERLTVSALVHLLLAVWVPEQAGQTWAVTFSVSVVLLSASALSKGEVERERRNSRWLRAGRAPGR